jgi:hypothetical protein
MTTDNLTRPLERENQILALILKVGVDIPEISRQTGLPVETVRYLYKEHILKRRMRVQRDLDHDKLGLSHIQFILTADPELEPLFFNSTLLSGLWEQLYVSLVYRVIPDDLFFLSHLAPPEFHPKLREFYRELEALGLLKVHETYECSRLTHPRMWVEDYNWEIPGWDFDWSPSSLKPPQNIEDPPVSEPVKLDKTDLLVVQHLQYRYDQSISDIAAKTSIDRYQAYWHFRKHVKARDIFGGYRINWLGTGRELKKGFAPQQRQTFVAINFIAKDLSPAEMMHARAYLHSIPYLYGEKVGASDYNAETFIPSQSLVEAFGFFARILRPLQGKARIITVDQSGAANYTVNPNLFDAESNRWVYNGDMVLEAFRKAHAGGTLSSGWKTGTERGVGASSD